MIDYGAGSKHTRVGRAFAARGVTEEMQGTYDLVEAGVPITYKLISKVIKR